MKTRIEAMYAAYVAANLPDHLDYPAWLEERVADLLAAARGAVAALTQSKTFDADIEAALAFLNGAIAAATP